MITAHLVLFFFNIGGYVPVKKSSPFQLYSRRRRNR